MHIHIYFRTDSWEVLGVSEFLGDIVCSLKHTTNKGRKAIFISLGFSLNSALISYFKIYSIHLESSFRKHFVPKLLWRCILEVSSIQTNFHQTMLHIFQCITNEWLHNGDFFKKRVNIFKTTHTGSFTLHVWWNSL